METRQRSLNNTQLDLLLTLYSFRFSTRSLLAQYLGIANNTSLYSKLTILTKHEYIAAKYDTSYKLAGREIEYYILPKGLRALRDSKRLNVTDTMLQASYKDSTVSDDFIKQNLLLFRARNILSGVHPTLQYFTTRDIQSLDYFPKPRPTAFLSLKTDQGIKRFFVEYIPAQTPTRTIKNRLKQYSRYFDEDTWSITDTPFPNVLYVCENGMTEQGVRWHIARELYKADADISYLITTQKALLNMQKNNTAVWTGIDSPDELVALAPQPVRP